MMGPDIGQAALALRQGWQRGGLVLDLTGPALPATVGFTRGGPAARIAASGLYETLAADAPRFDHDPVSLAPRGLLVEPAATNLILQASAPGLAPWATSGVAASGNSLAGPDGSSLSGWTISSSGYLTQDFATPIGATLTTSVWVRANQTALIGFRNLSASSADNVDFTIGPAWQRIAVTGVSAATSGRFVFDNRSSNGYGTAGLEIFLWNAQAEVGAAASSPIATTTAAATRAADQPGLPALAGPRDLRLRYDDGSEEILLSQSVTEGWWPPQARPRITRIALHPAGVLA